MYLGVSFSSFLDQDKMILYYVYRDFVTPAVPVQCIDIAFT